MLSIDWSLNLFYRAPVEKIRGQVVIIMDLYLYRLAKKIFGPKKVWDFYSQYIIAQ